MQTIVVTSTEKFWTASQKDGSYTQSTIDSSLEDVGYIHATTPAQTIPMLNRHYTDHDDILLLLVDLDKVSSEVKFEASSSGTTPGLFPHIYGPLNIDAVYKSIVPVKNAFNSFENSAVLAKLDS